MVKCKFFFGLARDAACVDAAFRLRLPSARVHSIAARRGARHLQHIIHVREDAAVGISRRSTFLQCVPGG